MSDQQNNNLSDAEMADLGNEFKPEDAKARAEAQKRISKNNIRNVFGSGKGRFAIIVVGLVAVSIFGLGMLNLFNRKAPRAQNQSADAALAPTPQGTQDSSAADAAEAQMRREANNEHGAQVTQQGGVYIPTPVTSNDGRDGYRTGGNSMAPASTPAASAPANPASAPAASASAPAAQTYVDPQWQNQMKKDEIVPQIIKAMGGSTTVFSTGQYSLPDRTPKAVTVATGAAAGTGIAQVSAQNGATASTAAAPVGPPLIDAGNAYYCSLRFGVNSDAARRDALANCYDGQKVFTVIGKAEPSGDNAVDPVFTVTFDKLSRPGKGILNITAIGFDDEGNQGMVDDVQSHAVRKYGGMWVGAALKGLGQAASIITGTTSATTVGNVTTTTTTTDRIDGKRTAEMAAGQVGVSMGDTWARDAASIKPTARLFRKKDLTVVFLAPVYEENK